ncbi:hypothetical protein BDZ45DRAFT_807298 [Acephala macrosclerotiorum]|nr:hypothetical protein BDZ45DRAFT_807298 [Acephala macrosclerotiorum]
MASHDLDAYRKTLHDIGAVRRRREKEDCALKENFEQDQAKLETDKKAKLRVYERDAQSTEKELEQEESLKTTNLVARHTAELNGLVARHKTEREARDSEKDEVIRKRAKEAQLQKDGLIGIFKSREDKLVAKFKEDQSDLKFKRDAEDKKKADKAYQFLQEQSRIAEEIGNQQAQPTSQPSQESQPSQALSSATAVPPRANTPGGERGRSPRRSRGPSLGRGRNISPWRYRDTPPRLSTARSPPRLSSPPPYRSERPIYDSYRSSYRGTPGHHDNPFHYTSSYSRPPSPRRGGYIGLPRRSRSPPPYSGPSGHSGLSTSSGPPTGPRNWRPSSPSRRGTFNNNRFLGLQSNKRGRDKGTPSPPTSLVQDPQSKPSSVLTGPRADSRPEYKKPRQERDGFQQTLASRPEGSGRATPATSSPPNSTEKLVQPTITGTVAPKMFANAAFPPDMPAVIGVFRVEPASTPQPLPTSTKTAPDTPKVASAAANSVSAVYSLQNAKNATVESSKVIPKVTWTNSIFSKSATASASPTKALQMLPRKLSIDIQTKGSELVSQRETSGPEKDRNASQTTRQQTPQVRAPSIAPPAKASTSPQKKVNSKAIPDLPEKSPTPHKHAITRAISSAPSAPSTAPAVKGFTPPKDVDNKAKALAVSSVKYTRAPPPPSPLREPTSKKLVNHKPIGRSVQPQPFLQADLPKCFPIQQVKYNHKNGQLVEWTACATSTPIRAAELREIGEAYKGYIPSKDITKSDGWHILPGTIKELEYFPEWAVIHVIRLDKEDILIPESWVKFTSKEVMKEFLKCFQNGWRLNVVVPREIDGILRCPMLSVKEFEPPTPPMTTTSKKKKEEKTANKKDKVKLGMFV